MRRRVFSLLFCALPLPALGQPAGRGPDPARHAEMLGQDFDNLPPGARERVGAAFRQGSPELDEAEVRQRWNAMTAAQRGETLRMHERRGAGMGQPHVPGPGPGPGPGGAPRR